MSFFIKASLTSRLTAFSLAALALVLLGFSATIGLAARSTLSQQADQRLKSAIETLTAAVEFDRGQFEWEPNLRLVAFGQEPQAGEIRWTVQDPRGVILDRSPNLGSPHLLDQLDQAANDPRSANRTWIDRRAWRILQRKFDSHQPDKSSNDHHYSALTLTAALCLDPTEANIAYLDRLLASVSLAVWLLAALLGRKLARRALAPLGQMAQSAREMNADELAARLPCLTTGDELQELANAFNGLLDRLQEAFERQARFNGDASHQLRTPLAAILGQIDVSLRRERSPAEYKQTLALVRTQTAQLAKIVEMLLFLSRADAEALLPDRQPVNLAGWTRTHLQSWCNHPRAADLVLEIPDDFPFLTPIHAPLLGQLLDNLLDNACKYSEPGSPIQIRVGLSSVNPKEASISLNDRGAGIPPEDLAHIFDPFFRSPLARKLGRPGLGLGLTIAQRIASAHQGTIKAETTPTQGTTFSLSLPFRQEDHEGPIDPSSRTDSLTHNNSPIHSPARG